MPRGFVSFAEVKRAVTMEAVLARYGLTEGLTQKGQNLAGPCPFCKGKSRQQFQVNPVKNAWYCFGCKEGGNVLDFVAKTERVGVRTAALRLDSWFDLGLVEETPFPVPVAASTEPPKATEEPLSHENPPLTFALKTLDPRHESLAPLGLSTATIERFGAGYCTKGLLKGRLAIPVHNGKGEIIAYVGLAVEEDVSPRYLFPPKFHPALEVFNLHRLQEFAGGDGRLYLVPEIEGALRLADAQLGAVLGLFDGSLSEAQEEAVRGSLTLFERLVLVGDGFEDRTVARLARHAPVTWAPDLPEEFFDEVVPSPEEEEA
jgi:DNA primase